MYLSKSAKQLLLLLDTYYQLWKHYIVNCHINNNKKYLFNIMRVIGPGHLGFFQVPVMVLMHSKAEEPLP